jgi:hypothetical protein
METAEISREHTRSVQSETPLYNTIMNFEASGFIDMISVVHIQRSA